MKEPGPSTPGTQAASDELLRRLIELNPGFLWATDRDLRLLVVSGQGIPARGAESPEEFVGRTLHELLEPGDIALEMHARALAGESVVYTHPRAEAIWQAHLEPLRGAEGEVEGTVGISVEVTDLVQAERELSVNRAQLDLALDQLPAIIWAIDTKLCVTSVAGRSIESESIPSWIGQPLADLLGGPDHPGIPIHEAALAGHPGQFILEVCRGAIKGDFQARVEPLRNRDDEIVGAVGFAVDVTKERRQHLAAEQLALLVRYSTDAIAGVDRDGRVYTWNPAAERLFGWSAEEMIGETTDRFIPPEQREKWSAARPGALARTTAEEFEATRMRKDGTPIRVWLTRSPILDERGDVAGFCVIVRDLGTRERIEDEREHEEKLAALSGLAGAVAHDFDDLVTAIAGYAEQLARELPAGGSRQTLDAIMVAAERAERLTSGLLEFSRRAPAQLPPLRFDPQALRETLLALAPPNEVPAETAAEPAPSVGAGARILLVEDELLVRRLVVQTLEGAGYAVTETSSPTKALGLIRDGVEVDLLVTDLVMPELYGDELVAEIRALRPDIPAVVMSGYVSDREAFGLDVSFLAKPFRPSELLAAVAAVLAQP